MQASVSRLVAVAAFCLLTSGCCTSLRRATEINAELREQNIARAGPAMHRAAQRQGATLLPVQLRSLGFRPLCSATQDTALGAGSYCVLSPGRISVRGGLGDVYQLLDHEGKRRIAITIGEAHSWARLAKRGETLLLLTPNVTFHQLDYRVQCECEGGPVIQSMSGYVNLGSAFLLDEGPKAEIQVITVPVVDDYVAWDCKVTYVRNDHVLRPTVAHAQSDAPARSRPQSASARSFRCAP